jgi:hypothetical protein
MPKSLLFGLALTVTLAGAAADKPFLPAFESRTALAPQGKIDELVFARWKRLGIEPASLCSDGVFVRRVYLDVIGTLPTAQEASQFLLDKDPGKRNALIDRLLDREEFADFWAMKWGDLLRVKSEFPINLWPNAVQAYSRWIRTSLKNNLPYDRFVREMLTSSGSNFRVPPVNFYRAVQSKEPQALAQAVALTFMGARADQWPKERLSGMTAFFSRVGYKSTGEWKEEIVYLDPAKGAVAGAVFPDGTPARLAADQDPREVFANWLLAPGNPWFARSIVNRVWSWLLGRGIVQEPDDIRPDNAPSNPELLAYLERELVAGRYDLKHIYRLVLNSQVYQLSSIPRTDRPEGVVNFAYYPLRRLDAEVLIDAVCQITGSTERYFNSTPEPFTFLPEELRSIQLSDGSISSAFLDMFGRPPRDTGLESERGNPPSADQRLHMLNSSHIQLKIQQSAKLRALMQPGGRPAAPIEGLYLTILSRYPTAEEMKVVAAYYQSAGGAQAAPPARWAAIVDIAWALVNSPEFLYRH